jgi:hypothetical protein
LPERLSCEDLTAVAQSLLPGGGPHSIAGLVDYAQSSARYLAGISAVVKRAGFLANKAGREKILRADISQAITESVMPSDETLARALADRPRLNTRAKPARSNLLPIPPQEPPAIEVPVPAAAGRRSITPAPATAGRRSITPAPALDDTPHQMQPA